MTRTRVEIREIVVDAAEVDDRALARAVESSVRDALDATIAGGGVPGAGSGNPTLDAHAIAGVVTRAVRSHIDAEGAP